MVPHTTTSVLLMDPRLLLSRLLMVPHTTRSVLLMDPRLLYVQARTGPETPSRAYSALLYAILPVARTQPPTSPTEVSVCCEGRC